ncbi:RHS repeat-associated core domain-containing protein [Nonomuraea sp. CA-143628]|uniref:RHS repeat domain-containing protein n=1 Tax=Nonomuraea sp. CA-143628 TaxID=3239997 RepID=UPI003D94D2E5
MSIFTALVVFAGSLVAPRTAQADVKISNRPGVHSKERVVTGKPVTAKPRLPDPAGKSTAGPAEEQPVVKALEGTKVRQLPGDGLLFEVTAPDGTAKVKLDRKAAAARFGGSYASRLHLVRLPACAVTTPDAPGCRTGTELGDARAQTFAATGETVVAAVAGESSDKGDYKATQLAPSASWDVSEQSGDFSWTYPMRVPPVPGELAPKVELSYSSGSMDGRTSNTNNQPSWVGEGFDFWPGYIQRQYKPCADDGAPKDEWGTPPGDLCWGYDNAVISWNGKGGELVQAGDDTWRMKSDDGTKVERLKDTGKGNGDDNGEYWKVTTPDGVQYFFGLNRLPGWSSGKAETRSAWTHPVFGDDSGEPCHGDSFASSWCQQAYRWNLDYVVDPHGNAISYWYTQETNRYGRNLKPADDTPYDRGGWLDRIEYGQRSDTLFTAKAPAKVLFGVSERCVPTSDFDCAADKIDDRPTMWPDVPFDLNCAAETECKGTKGTLAPTFWSRKRLTKVTTQVIKADGAYRDVDSWAIDHLWGDADIDKALLVKSIQHTGHAATPPITLPPVTFNHVQLPNRVDKLGDDIAPYIKYRIGAIYDESGGQIDVNYSEPDCTLDSLPKPETNTRRCFPVKWTPAGHEDPITDWFHKYVVTQVVRSDRTAKSPDMLTTYEYLDGAAWHFDDDDGMTKEKYKTWSQWRGYGHVRVEAGGQGDLRSQTDTWYLRGMDGDRLDASGGEKRVTVSDGEGGSHVDHDALQGFELKKVEYTKPGGTAEVKTVNTPWRHQTASRTRSWGTVTANLVGTGKTHTWTALGSDKWRETETNTTYETTAGLATTLSDLGDLATADDDRCARTTYARNENAWILNLVARMETVSVACSVTPDPAKHLIEDNRTYYDGGALAAAPAKGDISTSEKLAGFDAGKPAYVATESSTFDGYGRELTSKDAMGNVTTTAYTDTNGVTTAVKVTGPPLPTGAHVTSEERDPAFGAETARVDANNRRVDQEYDALGRLLKVWMADRSKADQTPNLEFSYRIVDGEIIAIGTRRLTADGGQAPPTYELYDGWQRLRQTQEPGPDGGRLISDKFYDTRGNVAREYGQYYSTGAPSTTLFGAFDGNVESQKAFEYDGRNRRTLERFLVGNGETRERWRTTTTYGGNWITVDPPAGDTATTSYTDARDQLAEVRQYHGSDPTGDYDKTTYTYTPLGKLATVKDPAGNVWNHTYDVRGREIRVDDPDKGTSRLTYDDLDRLITTEDARGQKVFTSYDALGRKLETRKDGPTGPLLTSRTYDTVHKGQLSSTTRYDGGQAYTITVNAYDNMERAIRTTVSVPSSEGSLAGSYVFDTRYKFDGTVQSNSFPAAGGLAAETVVYSYDDLRRPTTTSGLTSYVTKSVHSLTGKPEQYELSTGGKKVWITNSYEYGTQRLASARTDREDVAGVDRNVSYTYDDAGNVLRASDTSRNGTDTQCFTFDHLRRLTEAWTQATAMCAQTPTMGGSQPYWQSFSYDVTGNRTKEVEHGTTDTVRTYRYPAPGSPQPHTLTSVEQTGAAGARTDTFTYDAIGNTTSRNAQKLEWDAEGRLSKVTEGGKVSSYVYDVEGNRLLRRDPGSTTLYLPGMELRLDQAADKVEGTRFYVHDTVQVAVRTVKGVSFVANDHHGTGELAIDAATQSVTQRRYKPFGQLRGELQGGAWPSERGFVGGTDDSATGLVHLGAREYDPVIGRFISVDPVIDHKDPQQMNGYSYANNNPVTFTDPDGKWWWAWWVLFLLGLLSLLGGGGNGGGGGGHGGGGGGGGGAPHRSGPSGGVYTPLQKTTQDTLWSSVNPKKVTALGWLAYGLGAGSEYFNQGSMSVFLNGMAKADALRNTARNMPKGWVGFRWLFSAVGKWYDVRALRTEARAIKWAGRLGKAGGILNRFGFVATAVDGGLTQWSRDAGREDLNTGEKVTRASVRGGFAAGGSYLGATVAAGACGSVSAGTLAVACGFGGAVVGGVVGGWVGDGAIWGYDKARKPVINAAKSIGSGIKKGWNKLFG